MDRAARLRRVGRPAKPAPYFFSPVFGVLPGAVRSEPPLLPLALPVASDPPDRLAPLDLSGAAALGSRVVDFGSVAITVLGLSAGSTVRTPKPPDAPAVLKR